MRLVFLYIVLLTTALFCQDPVIKKLEDQILSLDSLLFSRAFNNCELTVLDTIVSDDLEFYHDQGGITLGKAAFIKSIREGICNLPYKPRRELQACSMRVFPMYKNGELYGAIQTGTHLFYAIEKDGYEHLTSKALFTHLWIVQQGSWKLSRVLSYAHAVPK